MPAAWNRLPNLSDPVDSAETKSTKARKGAGMNRHARRAARAKARKQSAGYIERLLAATAGSHPPGVFHVTVQHDDDCAIFAGGDCTCCPDMQRRAEGGDVVEIIGLDGAITSRVRRN